MAGFSGLVGLAVVKNEADIIEAMIRHNLQFLDALVVVDNASADQTAQIVGALVPEFSGRLQLRHDPRLGHVQQQILNALLRELGANHDIACFVPLDADEFLHADRAQLRSCLLAETRPVHLPWITYCPSASDDASQPNPVLRITHRRQQEAGQYYKTTFPRALLGQTRLKAGSHSVARQRAFDPQVIAGLALAHFPIRSPAQLWAKVVIGALNMRLRTGAAQGEGAQWHSLYQQLTSGAGLSQAQFLHEAAHYAARPNHPPVTLINDPLPVAMGARNLRHSVNEHDVLALKLAGFAAECVAKLQPAPPNQQAPK